MIAEGREDFLYLDLQNAADLNKLTEPQLFFEANRHSVICLDEIQQTPQLFSFLRSEIHTYSGLFTELQNFYRIDIFSNIYVNFESYGIV